MLRGTKLQLLASRCVVAIGVPSHDFGDFAKARKSYLETLQILDFLQFQIASWKCNSTDARGCADNEVSKEVQGHSNPKPIHLFVHEK